jgi:hypothetical protein
MPWQATRNLLQSADLAMVDVSTACLQRWMRGRRRWSRPWQPSAALY